MLITALCDMHLEIVTHYNPGINTQVSVVTKGQTFTGKILEEGFDERGAATFVFEFDDETRAYGLEKELWNIS